MPQILTGSLRLLVVKRRKGGKRGSRDSWLTPAGTQARDSGGLHWRWPLSGEKRSACSEHIGGEKGAIPGVLSTWRW